jgi:hypothetical protein
MIRTLPITADDLAEVGRFLNEHLNRKISSDDWVASLSHRWAENQPNHGMQLRDDGRLVGVFCAIYSDQWIDGKLERFCNPHSWCVLNEYRNHSIGLILPLLRQAGYHFTMYTPNPKVAEIFRGLKFRDLNDGLYYFPNLPSLRRGRRDEFVESDPDRIRTTLSSALQRDFDAHRSIRWLKFASFGNADDTCLLIYKRDTVKRLPCARIIHVSSADAFDRYGAMLGHHLLTRHGLPVSRIEARFLNGPPRHGVSRKRHQPKMVLSKTLVDSQFRDAYSELVALDV